MPKTWKDGIMTNPVNRIDSAFWALTSTPKTFKLAGLAAFGILLMSGVVQADGDVIKGEQIFKKCMACHAINDMANKVGPSLLGTVGRPVASVEGFNYSEAMKTFGAGGALWDEATLLAYIENPKAVVAKTKMAFAGLKKEDERADLIAFLKTKK
jgi:cytochrome c